jgi:glycosyltransferase involved in cell wall biosynthesis
MVGHSPVPKRVLILAPAIRPGGGPAGYVHNHMVGYEELRRAGRSKNEFVFLGRQASSDRGPGKSGALANSGVKTIIVSLGLKRIAANVMASLSWRQRRAKREISTADVVVLHGPYDTHLAPHGDWRATLIYMPHSPVIAADEYRDLLRDSHQEMGRLHYKNMRDEEGDVIGAADAVVFPSPGAGAEYERQFSERLAEKSVYIRSGCHVAAPITKTKSDIAASGTISVLYAGRYVSHRGFDIFCGAARRLKESGFEAEFYSAGMGPLGSDTQWVRDLGWRNDIFEVVRAVDIIVIPNRKAYCDLFVIECAALGKPMIISSVGGNADLAQDLPDIISCQPTIESLTDAVRQAVETHKASPNWGERNRRVYEADFTAERLAQRWDDLVCSLPMTMKSQVRKD